MSMMHRLAIMHNVADDGDRRNTVGCRISATVG